MFFLYRGTIHDIGPFRSFRDALQYANDRGDRDTFSGIAQVDDKDNVLGYIRIVSDESENYEMELACDLAGAFHLGIEGQA